MLSNSAIAGALASAYVTILVLHLNPSFPLTPNAVLPLALMMALAYGVHLAVAFYGLIVLRQLTASELLSPGWLSVRLLSWLCTIAAGGGAVIMWLNLGGFGSVLDPRTASRMTAGALTLSTSAVVFLLIGLAHLGRRGGNVSAVLLTAMMAISIAAPLAARGWGGEDRLTARPTAPILGVETARPSGKVIVFGVDGAMLDVISPAVAEGRLPNFGRIFDTGAVLHLATLRPTQAEPVWSAAATGRVPIANGVRASALYRVRAHDPALELLPDYCYAQALVRFGLFLEYPHDSHSLQSRPLWSILSDVGVRVAIVGFPLTHPVPTVNGLLVSDEFHRLTDADLDLEEGSAVAPGARVRDIRRALAAPANPDPVRLVSTSAQAPQGDADARPDPAPILADRMHLQILRELERQNDARFVAVRFPGLDAVAHYFLRYANPSAFGDVSGEELRRYGRVLSDYYGFIDTVVGRALESLGPDDLLLVVSPFGMEPLSPGKRVLERLLGNARISGTHERAPDGFLLAYGADVAPGRPSRGSILDFAPTILYYLGLPVGRDMDGFARTDLFRQSFTASRPITFIPTYGR
jgi:Type I phosphodiesterase / nucleotide pyrophosphatase